MARKALLKTARPTDDVLLGQVAKELGISRSTAWTRALRGEIPAEFRGGRFIVKRRTLNRLIAERRQPDTSGGVAA